MKKEPLATFEYGAAKNGATISFLPELNSIFLEWKGDVLLEEWIEILSRGIHEVKTRKIPNWIGDTSKLGATGEEHDQWTQEVFTTGCIEAGLKKIVVVLPDDVLGEMAMQEIMENIKNVADSSSGSGMESIFTKDLNEAIEWIKTGKR